MLPSCEQPYKPDNGRDIQDTTDDATYDWSHRRRVAEPVTQMLLLASVSGVSMEFTVVVVVVEVDST